MDPILIDLAMYDYRPLVASSLSLLVFQHSQRKTLINTLLDVQLEQRLDVYQLRQDDAAELDLGAGLALQLFVGGSSCAEAVWCEIDVKTIL